MHFDTPHDDHVTELEPYMRQPTVPLSRDHFRGGRGTAVFFLTSLLLPKSSPYLRVPATPFPSERVFSAAGLVVNRLTFSSHPNMYYSCRRTTTSVIHFQTSVAAIMTTD